MTSTLFDPDDAEHRMAAERLASEQIAWFTTVSPDGAPHAVPVWFWWQDERALVMTRPDAVKLEHVRNGSRVLMHLETGPFGGDVVILTGTATVSDRSTTDWIAAIGDGFEQKYRDAIEEFGTPLAATAAEYSTVIEFTPTRLLAW